MLPRGEMALFVQRAGETMIGGGPIETVLHVVVTRPKNHHRLTGSFGNLSRFHDEVRLIAPAEAAAHQRGVHNHFFRRQS